MSFLFFFFFFLNVGMVLLVNDHEGLIKAAACPSSDGGSTPQNELERNNSTPPWDGQGQSVSHSDQETLYS